MGAKPKRSKRVARQAERRVHAAVSEGQQKRMDAFDRLLQELRAVAAHEIATGNTWGLRAEQEGRILEYGQDQFLLRGLNPHGRMTITLEFGAGGVLRYAGPDRQAEPQGDGWTWEDGDGAGVWVKVWQSSGVRLELHCVSPGSWNMKMVCQVRGTGDFTARNEYAWGVKAGDAAEAKARGEAQAMDLWLLRGDRQEVPRPQEPLRVKEDHRDRLRRVVLWSGGWATPEGVEDHLDRGHK